jgi:hypothetical protein
MARVFDINGIFFFFGSSLFSCSLLTIYSLSIDHSLPDFKQRATPGNMEALLSHSKLSDGLILSSSEISAVEDFQPDPSLSTDVPAFYSTVDLPHCKSDSIFPRQSIRWSQCSLQHANTRFSIAPNGFAKYKRIQAGIEFIFFATPTSRNKIRDGAAFSNERYREELPPATLWEIHSIALLPGTTL